MNDRIALVSHSFAFVWTRLSFVFTRLYWSGLSFVFESCLLICTGLSFVFTRLIRMHSSCHSSVILVIPFCYDQKTLSLNHSHKKRKDSLETRAVLKEIFMLCWNLENGPKHRGWLQKNIAFPEVNKLFTSDFRANLNETNADMIQFIKSWNWKWIV